MWRSESCVPKGIDDSVTLHRWFLKGLNIKDECTMVLVNVEIHSPKLVFTSQAACSVHRCD